MAETASYVRLPTFYGSLCEKFDNVPSYHTVWAALVARQLPGRQVGMRWEVREDAEQAAVVLFGLTRVSVAA
jgi:hypothetical protein